MKRILSKQIAMLAVLMMVFAFAGCSDDDDDSPTNPGGGGATDQVSVVTTAGDAYMASSAWAGRNISAADFFTGNVDRGIDAYTPDNPNYFVVDLRSQADFDYAHIRGAELWSLSDVITNFDQLPTDQTIIFTCKTGQTASYATSIVNVIGTQTGHTAKNLLFGANGYLPPQHVGNGNPDYRYPTDGTMAPNFVVTAAPAKPAAGDFPTVMTEAETAQAVLLERAAAIIGDWGNGDARVGDIVAFAADADNMVINFWGETDYLNGHFPGAYQYTPTADVRSDGALNTLPVDKAIGIYCWTGQTSAQMAGYLRMVGYDAKTIMYGTNGMAYDRTNYPALTHTFTPAGADYMAVVDGTWDDVQ